MLVEGYKLYNYMCQSNLLRMCKFLAYNTYLQNPKHPMSLKRKKLFAFGGRVSQIWQTRRKDIRQEDCAPVRIERLW